MKKLLAATVLIFASQFAFAQAAAPAAPSGDCEARAVNKKTGKPLAGAAKKSFMKKCATEASPTAGPGSCEEKAVGKNGKALAGAAKTAFIKKCEKDAAAGK